jgi:hypothetical protein
MRGLLYLIAVILLIGWAIGFFFLYSAGRLDTHSDYSRSNFFGAGCIEERINTKAQGTRGKEQEVEIQCPGCSSKILIDIK